MPLGKVGWGQVKGWGKETLDEAKQDACPDGLGEEINPPKGRLMVKEVGEERGEHWDMRGKDSAASAANVRTGHGPISLHARIHPSLWNLWSDLPYRRSTVTHHRAPPPLSSASSTVRHHCVSCRCRVSDEAFPSCSGVCMH